MTDDWCAQPSKTRLLSDVLRAITSRTYQDGVGVFQGMRGEIIANVFKITTARVSYTTESRVRSFRIAHGMLRRYRLLVSEFCLRCFF